MSEWQAAEGISMVAPHTSSVLVTGAAGFVGSHVTEVFAAREWNVDEFDIGDKFPDEPVDVVVSLAATAEPAEALRDPAAAYANSTRIMVETLEYARDVGARVLHVSTNEAHPPVGPYGGAKACQEIICGTYPDVQVTIVVTQSLYGERQQPNKLVPTAIRSLLAGEPVTLQRNGTRWASRPFMYVGDLAYALFRLAGSDEVSPRVHVGAQSTICVRDVVASLADALGVKGSIMPIPAGDRPGHELDVKPIGCDLEDWWPVSAAEGLPYVARWYRDNPEWLTLR
jgi:dTDP-glucose 4,6-dehydratase